MTLDGVLTVLFTGVVYLNVVALVGAILFANVYAIVHAWRSGRMLWCAVLALFFLSGGGIATPFYLILFHDEPVPGGLPWRRRAHRVTMARTTV